MSPVVNLRRSGNASHVPLVDRPQEYLAGQLLFDAFHRNHKVTYPCDASASRALDDVQARQPIAPHAGFPVYGVQT